MNLHEAAKVDDPLRRAIALAEWKQRADGLVKDYHRLRAATVRDMRDADIPWSTIVATFGKSERYLRAEAGVAPSAK